jgi:predicted ATPase
MPACGQVFFVCMSSTGQLMRLEGSIAAVPPACRGGHDPARGSLGAISETLDATDKHEIRYYETEIHRLKGELLLRQDDSNFAEAERCFKRAVGIARWQRAKSFELRAATSLARLLAKQGRRAEAQEMLADIYNWFTEGFDTADLKDAKALLDELNK